MPSHDFVFPGNDLAVLLDGEPVAYLTGAVNLKASDIALVRTNV